MRTLAHLYDNDVPKLNLFNVPNPPIYAEGDEVVVVNGLALDGMVGHISSIIPAPPTDSLRSRPHAYFVRFPNRDRSLFNETELGTLVQ